MGQYAYIGILAVFDDSGQYAYWRAYTVGNVGNGGWASIKSGNI